MMRDFYAENLAQVNQTNSVTTAHDIFNEKGVMVVSSGTLLTSQTAQRIAKHKLALPLEHAIQLDRSCNVEQDILLLPEHPEVQKLLENGVGLGLFQAAAKQLNYYPLLKQKLTVLKQQYPKIYKKSVMGAYIALLLGQEQTIPSETLRLIFLAAIARDLGVLHIDPNIVNKQGVLTNEEKKQLEGHVAIGYHFLKLLPGLPPRVARAVLEHHERTDGFGYPKYKAQNELCREGQIVAFADSFIGIFYKYVFGLRYSVQAIASILQINAGIHDQRNTDSALRLLNKFIQPLQLRHSKHELCVIRDQITQRMRHLNEWYKRALQLNNNIQQQCNNFHTKRTNSLFERINETLTRSGINDQRYVNWLHSIKEDQLTKEDSIEIEQYALMLNEGSWQLNHLNMALSMTIQTLEINKKEFAEDLAMFEVLETLVKHFNEDLL
ncbi:hypothetical protein C2869_07860 [Saccharobesus litoralis]|uniref:HD-GYP domain-containing protein n=1 Tax=Saccharobesus litoralis TaxID=2172099 RepID=A0A2S0VQ61_9ALTE|nr:HD domain-containing phosphohydrolase [Saccharobesus litoralis]AWB66353.1 hypothetical protein C2869_07860 [Saccharobesus litoralis]